MQKVLVCGSFDKLHSGHVRFLKVASEYGELYVGTGSDYSIEKYKGEKPVCTEDERLFMLNAIKYVHQAFINSGEGPMDFIDDITELKPDIFICNEDQDMPAKRELCNKLGITYIVLKRTPEPGLPVRTTTNYKNL